MNEPIIIRFVDTEKQEIRRGEFEPVLENEDMIGKLFISDRTKGRLPNSPEHRHILLKCDEEYNGFLVSKLGSLGFFNKTMCKKLIKELE